MITGDTPRYFDDSPQQFLQVAPPATGILQRVLHGPGHEWGFDERARNFDLLEEAPECLAESNCRVIGQVGSKWVRCRETAGPAEIEGVTPIETVGSRVEALEPRFTATGRLEAMARADG